MILMKMRHLLAEAAHGSESNTLRDLDGTGLAIREPNGLVEVRKVKVLAHIRCLSCQLKYLLTLPHKCVHNNIPWLRDC